MVKTNTKYYVQGEGIRNSNSLPRMRLNAVRAIMADPYRFNPVNIYSDGFMRGIYPVNTVKMLPDGRFVCYDDKLKVKRIAKDGTLTDDYRGYYRWLSAITPTALGSME